MAAKLRGRFCMALGNHDLTPGPAAFPCGLHSRRHSTDPEIAVRASISQQSKQRLAIDLWSMGTGHQEFAELSVGSRSPKTESDCAKTQTVMTASGHDPASSGLNFTAGQRHEPDIQAFQQVNVGFVPANRPALLPSGTAAECQVETCDTGARSLTSCSDSYIRKGTTTGSITPRIHASPICW
jgi:hypothetical protein